MVWLGGLQIVFLASFIARLSCLVFLHPLKEMRVKESGTPMSTLFWQVVLVGPVRGINHVIAHPYHMRLRSHGGLKLFKTKIENNK